jgi:hypothetical protein
MNRCNLLIFVFVKLLYLNKLKIKIIMYSKFFKVGDTLSNHTIYVVKIIQRNFLFLFFLKITRYIVILLNSYLMIYK